MATLYAVLAAVQQQIIPAVTGLVSASRDTAGLPLNVLVGTDWPSQRTLQDNIRGGKQPTALVSVFDRGLASDTTRWTPQELWRSVTPATVTASPMSATIPAGGSVAITIGSTVTPGDAIAIVVTAQINNWLAQVITGTQADTPSTFATSLAAAVSGDADLSAVLSASASGPILTLKSLAITPVPFRVNIGNGATRTREIARRSREIQIATWARTIDDRNVVGDAIEPVIAALESDFGVTFPDGTMGRVLFRGDHQIDDAVIASVYRRDFLLSVEYPITATDALFAVLAPILRNTTF